MTASGLGILPVQPSQREMQGVIGYRGMMGFGADAGDGPYRRAVVKHEQVGMRDVPGLGVAHPPLFLSYVPRKPRSGRPRRPGQAWLTSDKIPREEESEEEQEIAEALFDLANLANLAAAASASPAPSAGLPPAEDMKAERPKAEDLEAAAGEAPDDAAALAGRLQAAAEAADAADPVTAMVSPRKRQRKPNRNLVLYEEFGDDDEEDADFHAFNSRRGGHGANGAAGQGGARGGGRGAHKVPRLEGPNRNHESAAANYPSWTPQDGSTADSKELSQQRQQGAGAQALSTAAVHPAVLLDRGIKRISQVYLAHFIDWHRAQGAARGGGGSAAGVAHPTAVGPGQRAERGPQQQQKAPGAYMPRQPQQGLLPSNPPSPSSRLQQLLAGRGLAGAAGLFAGAQGHALPAPLPPPSLLERHGPPGGQPGGTAGLMSGGYNMTGGMQQMGSGFGEMIQPGGPPQQAPAGNGVPLGLNGLPAIRTHPAGFPGRARPPPPPQQQQALQGPHGAPAYSQAAAMAKQPAPQQQHGYMQQVQHAVPGPTQHLLGHHLLQHGAGAGGAAHAQPSAADVPQLLNLLMSHHQQTQQAAALAASAGGSGGLSQLANSMRGGWGGWTAQQQQAQAGRNAVVSALGALQQHHQQQQQAAAQHHHQQQDAARMLLQQQIRQAQQAVLAQQAQQQRAAQMPGATSAPAPGREVAHQAQQYVGGGGISKLALHSEAEQALRTLQQALPLLAKHAQQQHTHQHGALAQQAQQAPVQRSMPASPSQRAQQQASDQARPASTQPTTRQAHPPSISPRQAQQPGRAQQGAAGADPSKQPMGAAPEAAGEDASPQATKQPTPPLPAQPPSPSAPSPGPALQPSQAQAGDAPQPAESPVAARRGATPGAPARTEAGTALAPAAAAPAAETGASAAARMEGQDGAWQGAAGGADRRPGAAAPPAGAPLPQQQPKAPQTNLHLPSSSMFDALQHLVKASLQQAVNGDQALRPAAPQSFAGHQPQAGQQWGPPQQQGADTYPAGAGSAVQQPKQAAQEAHQPRGPSPALAAALVQQAAQQRGPSPALLPSQQKAREPSPALQQHSQQQQRLGPGEYRRDSAGSGSIAPPAAPPPASAAASPPPLSVPPAGQAGGAGGGQQQRDAQGTQAQFAQLLMQLLPKQLADSAGALGQAGLANSRGTGAFLGGGQVAAVQQRQQQPPQQQ